ncbi:Mfa1 family fimbria major subunit [Porphyromonas levii]|uniref:Mfa1 family fimbria major subunit n=1 Tax=Porphyromonas levii TaxID=28114 RepID=UPI001BAA2600|nr:Mfa1 family fimbria major subunit [Porphyromonas levii]MBR8704046.1 Minor fimbrium subunit Mfa1 [Porphyromonas levii]
MKRFLTIGAIFALALGFASCDKNKSNEPDTPIEGGDTYVGLSLKFPGADNGLKAFPDENYNSVAGSWKGRDDIQDIAVYLVTAGKAVTSEYFTKTDFNGIDENGMLTPRLAVEAVAGEDVSAYVIINASTQITEALKAAGWELGKKVDEVTKPTSGFDAAFNQAIQLSAVSDVAKYDNGKQKDIIMMTNEVAPAKENGGLISVNEGITAEAAKNGTDNQIKVNVVRVASRAMVTIAKTAKDTPIKIKRTNLTTGKIEETAQVMITGVEYAATGSSLQLNPIQPDDLKAPKGIYDFIPGSTYWKDFKGAHGVAVDGTPVEDSKTLFSYADPYATVTVMETYTPKESEIVEALEAEKTSKFLLPITHAEGNYKKGNTAFFTIRATFEAFNMVDGVKTKVEPADGNLYLGKTDGKFYTSLEKAQMKDQNFTGSVTEAQQEVIKYTGSVMFYNIWINPDVPYAITNKKIKESPVFRNQVYHAHITGFKEIGLNWTPNKDTDKPDKPDKPDDPDNPDDPDDPFNPDDPLETDKTYLSVQLKVLDYTLHSYNVDLGNRY